MKKILLLLLAVTAMIPSYLSAQTFPELSRDGVDKWFSLYSHRAGKVLQNNGVGTDEVVNSTSFEELDNLRWKFEATGETEEGSPVFKIVSKSGGELSYGKYEEDPEGNYLYDEENDVYIKLDDDVVGTHSRTDRWYVRSTGSTFIFKQYNDNEGFTFQIWCIEEGSYINMTNNTEDFQICIYDKDNDGGNPFSAFTTLDDLYANLYDGAPMVSTESSPKWYYLRACRTGRVFGFDGNEESKLKQLNIIVAASVEQDYQLFRFEGSYEGFKIINKATGYELKYDGSSRIIFGEEGDGEEFSFVSFPDKDGIYGKGKWELRYTNGSCINETGGEACLYGLGDNGNAIEFIEGDKAAEIYKDAPKLSTEVSPIWYHIQNMRNDKAMIAFALADGGLTSQRDVITDLTADSLDNQLFRFEGNYDKFKIISKVGGELKYDPTSQRIIAVALENGDFFKFQPAVNKDFGDDKWSIANMSDEGGRVLNAHNNKFDEVVLYGASDAGSVYAFILSGLTNSLSESNISKTQVVVDGKNLILQGEDILASSLYAISGSKIADFEEDTYTLPTAGCFLLTIRYTDGSTESFKIVAQ